MMSISSYKRAPQQDADRTLTFDQSWENDKNGDVLLQDTNTAWVDTGTIWSTLLGWFAPPSDLPLNPVFQVSGLKKPHQPLFIFSNWTFQPREECFCYLCIVRGRGGVEIRWKTKICEIRRPLQNVRRVYEKREKLAETNKKKKKKCKCCTSDDSKPAEFTERSCVLCAGQDL